MIKIFFLKPTAEVVEKTAKDYKIRFIDNNEIKYMRIPKTIITADEDILFSNKPDYMEDLKPEFVEAIDKNFKKLL